MNLSWIGDFLKNTENVAGLAHTLNKVSNALGIKNNMGIVAETLGAGAGLQKAFGSPNIGTQTTDNKSLAGMDEQPWLDMIAKPEYNVNYNQEFNASDSWITDFMPDMSSIANVSYEYSTIPGVDFNFNPNMNPSDPYSWSSN